jgi:hypothetical protein
VKGYYQRTRDQWLFSRYLAERFRSASFQVLIQPRFWGPIEPVLAEWHSALETEKSRIDSLLNADEAAEHDEELIVPEPEVCASTMSEFTRRLGTHYRERRLEPQIDYLDRLVARRRIWYDNPVVQPTVFIVSVVAVLLHAAFEWDGRETASVVFVFLAAALPIVWTGIRTWRGANEQARNVSRSRAKAEILRARSEWLKTELAAAETPNALHVFTVLAISENLLRNELREWLRLMLETEWYG